ncbi:MAG: ATP synthase F1 subunit delta [Phycisphaerales bacterium]|nr:ATP synthase F1 subunit delta [Phycisphaerales bacterium]
MAQTTRNSPHAVAYARALLELANSKGQAEQIGAELNDIRQILLENKAFAAYLRDPAVGNDQRTAAIKRIFGGRVNGLILNTLGVMASKGRIGELGAMCDAYDDLLDQQLGKVEVDVTVARRLTPEELEHVRQRVSEALGRQAVIHQYVDESIIGGIIIRVQDQLIDGSVRKQLETLKKRMLASRP